MTASMYPLQWPEGWARTEPWRRRSDNYKVTIEKAVAELHRGLTLLGALNGSIVLSSNVPPRNALGTPRNDGTKVADPGVAVWWATRAHGERVIACDKWDSVRGNVRAIGLAIDGLRTIERAGASQILERAFTAFGQLPPAAAEKIVRPWWEVFGFPHAAIGALSMPVIEARYRELARNAHPDRGGSDAAMVELNEAKAAAALHYGGAP